MAALNGALLLLIVAVAVGCQRTTNPTLTASPNPVSYGSGFGTTTISWDTHGSGVASIYLTTDDQPTERLFASGERGQQDVAWIAGGNHFTFRLHIDKPGTSPIATVTVTRRTEVWTAVVWALSAMGVFLVFAAFNRRWGIELAPTVCVGLALWVKWVAATAEIGPHSSQQTSLLFGTAAALFVLCGPLLLVPRKSRAAVALLLDLVLTLLVLADLLYFRYFGNVPTASVIPGVVQWRAFLPSLGLLFRLDDSRYFIDILAAILGSSVWVALRLRHAAAPLYPRIALAAVLTVSGLVASRSAQTLNRLWQDDRAEEAPWMRLETIPRIGLLQFHAFDAWTKWRYPVLGPQQVTERAKTEAARFLVDRLARETVSPLFGVARGRNLIIVMVESLARFPVGLRIQGKDVTPNLSAFAQESMVFSNFFDETYEGGTSDAEFLSNQSLLPLSAGAVALRFPDHRFRGLAGILSERGYSTLSGVGATSDLYNIGRMHPALGYQRSLLDDPTQDAERIQQWLADGVFFQKMLTQLQVERAPFASYMVTSSTHAPYELPTKYQDFSLGEFDTTVTGRYLATVHYLDRSFGDFIDGLRRAGLLESSVVALYGDHRPFLEDDWELIGHVLRQPTAADGIGWLNRRRLPFFVRLPRGEHRGEVDVPGGQLDVAPTLLSLLGVRDDTKVMLGSDITTPRRPGSPVVFRDGSSVSARVLYRRGLRLSGADACYQLPEIQVVDCALSHDQQEQATKLLAVSDAIVIGDLVPDMTDALSLAVRQRTETPTHAGRSPAFSESLVVGRPNVGPP